MKNNYINSLILGIMCFTINMGQSQNILFDGDFSVTTEIIPFNTPTPPINTWAFWVNEENGSEANPAVVDGVCNFQIINPGNNTWNVQLAQWGFPLIQGHSYQLLFDVKAEAGRSFGVFLGEDGGEYFNLIGYDRYFYNANTQWLTHSIEFEATSVFDLHKLSFELGTDLTTIYFDNVILQDLSSDTLTKVSLIGTLQDELGCAFDYDYECDNPALIFNSSSGAWEGSFTLPAGCYTYRVKETSGNNVAFYGENGNDWPEIQLYVPSDGEITFSYDPKTHIVSSTPYNEAQLELTEVSLIGTLQNELGCDTDYDYECNKPDFIFNPDSGLWEGSFTLPAGCYTYMVKELFGCTITIYGEDGIEWGNEFQLYIPIEGEISFIYDPQTHILSSTPYSGAPQQVTTVSLIGTLQDELGCSYDNDYGCDKPALIFNSASGVWEGSFTLPAGCYNYRVKETFGCNIANLYGENGTEWGNEIQLYVPLKGEITFSYDPQTHVISSTPYSGAPQEITKVSLLGSLQDELGCGYDGEYECDNPALLFNPASNAWEGSFTLPAGCYLFRVKETFGCSFINLYGENGVEGGNEIQLYIPTNSEITFSYNPETHILSSTPYSGAPQEVSKVALYGDLQDDLGCDNEYDFECDKSELLFNSDTSLWEESFTLPAGCYTYWVKETLGCIVNFYGENGTQGDNGIQLYVPLDGEITFTYDPQTHVLSSTPYSGVPQEVTTVSLMGTLQDELGCDFDYNFGCDYPELLFNSDSGAWEGSFTLSAGCYTYRVKEKSVCNETFYGEKGVEWGEEIQLYVPSEGEITFSYNPETHILSSTPFGGSTLEASKVSFYGSLQDELGCAYDYEHECEYSALSFNSGLGIWEGSFTLPAGCYTYMVKETTVCNNVIFYGENGIEWSDEIQLYVPLEGEISFSYDPQTHIMSSTPYSGIPQEVKTIFLIGTLQDELGCAVDFDFECDKTELLFNSGSGAWEGSFTLPAGCYTYWVEEATICDVTYYGENGIEYGDGNQLFVPTETQITFSYDPQTHVISSSPYNNISTIIQCPDNILVNNEPGVCGAVVNYPEIEITADCGGEIISITQTQGLPSGSFFPVGKTINTFVVTKTTGEEIPCSFDVVVNDTEPPVISDLNQNYEPLWPPNHKMVPVFIEYLASDNCNIATTVISISSNEPENGLGDGDQAPDWEILDEHNVLLRAERSGKGNGREYYITIKVTDSSGNYSEQLVTVTVPRDNGKKSEVVIESEPGNNKYILYPNAADDKINIKGPKSTSQPAYVIYDMLGVMRKQGKINNDQIEVISLPSGVYILKFEVDKTYIFKKFIKN